MRAEDAARSVRVRVSAAAAAAVAIALAIVAVALVSSQRRQLTDAVDDTVRRRAAELETRMASGPLAPIQANPGDPEETAIQVVVGGRVISATGNLAGAGPITDIACGETIRTRSDLVVDNSRFRVLSRCVETAEGDGTAHVAVNLDDVDESVAALVRSLLIAIPVLLVLLAALLWWVVGRLLGRVIAAAAREQRFVADASHELRSPLARMRTALEVDGDAAHGAVLADVRDLGELVDDLLTIARLDARTPLRSERVDLDDIVLRAIGPLRDDPRVNLDVQGVSAAQVRGDAAQLERVVQNLLENAGRHARSTVRVELQEVGDGAQLVVEDDGAGVPADQRERVFERFARVDDARTPGAGGTGLGLAIAQTIVERHGGTIAIDPTYTAGARFVVRLPVAASRADPGPSSRR
jgi:signal transduction histidine kinase